MVAPATKIPAQAALPKTVVPARPAAPQPSTKIPFHRTLGFRLFFLVALQVILAAGLAGWHSVYMFNQELDKNDESNVISVADKSARSIANVVRNWNTSAIFLGHAAGAARQGTVERVIQNVIRFNQEIVAVEFYDDNGSQTLQRAALLNQGSPLVEKLGQARHAELMKVFKQQDETTSRRGVRKQDTSLDFFAFAGENFAHLTTTLEQKNVSGKLMVHVIFLATSVVEQLVFDRGETSFLLDPHGRISLKPDPAATPSFEAQTLKEFASNSEFGRFRAVTRPEGVIKISIVPLQGLNLFLFHEKTPQAQAAVAPQVLKIVMFILIIVVMVTATSYLAVSTISRGIHNVIQATVAVAAGRFDIRIPVKNRDEVGMLSASVNKLAHDMQVLLSVEKEAVRQAAELKTAQAVESMLFPVGCDDSSLPIRSIGRHRAATECAGDWWTAFRIDDHRFLTAIADSTGHGASAALIVALAHSFFQTLKDMGSTFASPAQTVHSLNKVLWSTGHGKTTMTLFLAVFDLKTGKLTYTNAGHHSGLLVSALAKDKRMRGEARLKPLVSRGNVLGAMADSEYRDSTIDMAPGDKVAFFTDGLIECKNAAGQVIKPRDFHKFLEQLAPATLDQAMSALLKQIDAFFGKTPLDDDITLVLSEVTRSWHAGGDA